MSARMSDYLYAHPYVAIVPRSGLLQVLSDSSASVRCRYCVGVGLLSSGLELRSWEGVVAAAISTHGEMQAFEQALERGTMRTQSIIPTVSNHA